MKIQYCSDLHLEFSDNNDFLHNNPLIPEGEILLLAGDLVPFSLLEEFSYFIDLISDAFEKIYWVPGNHEYYRYDMAKKSVMLNEKIRSNFFLVNNLEVDYKNVKLIFSTLWSKISADNEFKIQRSIRDFDLIKVKDEKLTPTQFSDLHNECFSFVESAVRNNKAQKTIIITHHVPTLINYPPHYKTDPLNEAFAVELFDVIENSNADYWIYGHHHTNVPEFKIGKTKMITNQLGYVAHDEHLQFRRDAVIVI